MSEIVKESEDYSREVDYINNYLSEKAIILKEACRKLSKKWEEFNMEVEFKLETKAIYFNKKFRMKVLVESEYKDNNNIFYVRQDSVSVALVQHKPELKECIQDFVLSVMGDFIERGMESYRREAINDYRERLNLSDEQKDNFLITYPLKPDDVFPTEDI